MQTEILVPESPANRALLAAIRKNDLAGVRRAFAQGASPNAYVTTKDLVPGERPPRQPLLGFIEPHESREVDKPRAVAIFREFLAHKVNIKALGESQMSAIHWAAHLGDVGLVKEVLARGADINAPSKMWGTPLSIAIMPGLRDKEGPEVPLITFLLEHGANPNVFNSLSGLTPLMFTAIANHPKTAALLLKHGADPALVSKTRSTPVRKRTAFQWALSAGSTEVARILRAVSPEMTVFEAALDGNFPCLRKLPEVEARLKKAGLKR